MPNFQASLSDIARPCLKTNKRTKKPNRTKQTNKDHSIGLDKNFQNSDEETA
jgi:hypothetical protein